MFLLYFFGIVSFVTKTFDQFQFQSQVRLSLINEKVPIRLKFKLYSVIIKWGSRIVVTTTLDNFELQCQKRLYQINVIVPIRFKLKLYANFIKWCSWINFLFMRGEDIVNNWDFPSKICRNCHKRFVPKVTRHDYWEMFVKMSLRDRLICSADFVGMTLLALRFLPPACRTPTTPFRLRLFSPNCFLNVCLPQSLLLSW